MAFLKIFNAKYLISLSTLISAAVFAEPVRNPLKLPAFPRSNPNLNPLKAPETPRDERLRSEDCMEHRLQGRIVDGRYYAPKDLFSCRAEDFDVGEYFVHDALSEFSAGVSFYSPVGDFKKMETLFMPELESKKRLKEYLKYVFNSFCIETLLKVDYAQGIEVLNEEMVGDEMLFVGISVEKMSVLKTPDGEHMASTRGHLLFENGDKLVILTNQWVTVPDEKHEPKKHIERLKREILEFKNTFKFGRAPSILLKNRTGAP